jgi:hypothetical protein
MIGGVKTMKFEHVIKYDLTNVAVDELQAMYEFLEEQHGAGKFLFIPNEFTYTQFAVEDMIKIRDRMNEIIEEAQNAN